MHVSRHLKWAISKLLRMAAYLDGFSPLSTLIAEILEVEAVNDYALLSEQVKSVLKSYAFAQLTA